MFDKKNVHQQSSTKKSNNIFQKFFYFKIEKFSGSDSEKNVKTLLGGNRSAIVKFLKECAKRSNLPFSKLFIVIKSDIYKKIAESDLDGGVTEKKKIEENLSKINNRRKLFSFLSSENEGQISEKFSNTEVEIKDWNALKNGSEQEKELYDAVKEEFNRGKNVYVALLNNQYSGNGNKVATFAVNYQNTPKTIDYYENQPMLIIGGKWYADFFVPGHDFEIRFVWKKVYKGFFISCLRIATLGATDKENENTFLQYGNDYKYKYTKKSNTIELMVLKSQELICEVKIEIQGVPMPNIESEYEKSNVHIEDDGSGEKDYTEEVYSKSLYNGSSEMSIKGSDNSLTENGEKESTRKNIDKFTETHCYKEFILYVPGENTFPDGYKVFVDENGEIVSDNYIYYFKITKENIILPKEYHNGLIIYKVYRDNNNDNIIEVLNSEKEIKIENEKLQSGKERYDFWLINNGNGNTRQFLFSLGDLSGLSSLLYKNTSDKEAKFLTIFRNFSNESVNIDNNSYTIGRSLDCDYHLPDFDSDTLKFLRLGSSRVHALIKDNKIYNLSANFSVVKVSVSENECSVRKIDKKVGAPFEECANNLKINEKFNFDELKEYDIVLVGSALLFYGFNDYFEKRVKPLLFHKKEHLCEGSESDKEKIINDISVSLKTGN